MAGETGYIRSENKLVIAGNALDIEKEIEDIDDVVYPGMLVKIGSTLNTVLMNDGVTVAYGWAGYEKTAIPFRPKDMDTAYKNGDRASIMHGPGMTLRALITAGAADVIVAGDKLVGITGGLLAKWTPITGAGNMDEEHVEATAVENSLLNDKYLLVRSKI